MQGHQCILGEVMVLSEGAHKPNLSFLKVPVAKIPQLRPYLISGSYITIHGSLEQAFTENQDV